jgi:hypothetical protein
MATALWLAVAVLCERSDDAARGEGERLQHTTLDWTKSAKPLWAYRERNGPTEKGSRRRVNRRLSAELDAARPLLHPPIVEASRLGAKTRETYLHCVTAFARQVRQSTPNRGCASSGRRVFRGASL